MFKAPQRCKSSRARHAAAADPTAAQVLSHAGKQQRGIHAAEAKRVRERRLHALYLERLSTHYARACAGGGGREEELTREEKKRRGKEERGGLSGGRGESVQVRQAGTHRGPVAPTELRIQNKSVHMCIGWTSTARSGTV